MKNNNSQSGFMLEEATIEYIKEALDSGRVTSRELVIMYLRRIADYDKDGPKINSVLEINPDALHIAEAMDIERTQNGCRGPLHGIPVLIKDNINTGDKMHTSAGSIALENSYAPYDAFIVKKLREAGAIILGKANMTEFANFMAYDMPSGYSSRGGQVLNPYGPEKFTPGGSSSGSGAAVACNFCAAAIGTETSGSILSPSCQNSIVGIKPTVGLVSRSGIVPIAHSQDTAGPMARTVADAAVMLGVIQGADDEDAATKAGAGKSHQDYTAFLDRDGLRGAKLGIPMDYFYGDLNDDEKAIMDEAVEKIKGLGASVIDVSGILSKRDIESYNVLVYEFKNDLNAYLASLGPGAPVHTLSEVIKFNEQHSEAALKHGQALLIDSDKTSGTLTEPPYLRERIYDLRVSREDGIDAVLNKYEADALLFLGLSGAAIAAKAGYPSVIVPGGYSREGEPIGVTFTGTAFSEPTLIKFAYAFEQATKKRSQPGL